VAAQRDVRAMQRKAEAASQHTRNYPGSGLKEAVRVQRDRWGVAHIYPETPRIFSARALSWPRTAVQMSSGSARTGDSRGTRAEAVARDLNAAGSLSRDMRGVRSYAPDAKAILEAFTGNQAYIAETERPGGRGLPSNFRLPASSRRPGMRGLPESHAAYSRPGMRE